MNFQHRGGWSFHIIGEDCRTVLLSYRCVAGRDALSRIVAKLHGDTAQAENDIRRWGRGSVWIDPSPAQCKALGIGRQEAC